MKIFKSKSWQFEVYGKDGDVILFEKIYLTTNGRAQAKVLR